MKIFGSTKEINETLESNPTVATLKNKYTNIFSKTVHEVSVPFFAPVKKSGKSYFQVVQCAKPNPITDIAERVDDYKQVALDMKAFTQEAKHITTDCDEKLKKLSIFKPDTWKELLLETIDSIVISFFGPLIHFGTYNYQKAEIAELSEFVIDRLEHFKSREVNVLCQYSLQSSVKKIEAIEALAMLGEVLPDNQRHARLLGKLLAEEHAYGSAATCLEHYLKEHPSDASTILTLLQVYQAQNKVVEAISLFEKCELSFGGTALKNNIIFAAFDLYYENGDHEKAAEVLKRSFGESEGYIRRLMKVSDDDAAKSLFYQLPQPRRDLLSQNIEKAEMRFRLERHLTEEREFQMGKKLDQALVSEVENELKKEHAVKELPSFSMRYCDLIEDEIRQGYIVFNETKSSLLEKKQAKLLQAADKKE